MSDSGDVVFWALIGGPLLVTGGLVAFGKKRLLENIPTSKIRSAAMGFVELNGLAKPRKEIKDPIDNLPCCWWQCVVQEDVGDRRELRKVITFPELFYLEDDTGKVLIDPQEAEFMYIHEKKIKLDSNNRHKFEPVLVGWGLDCTGWFGTLKKMRIILRTIRVSEQIYVLGELTHRYDYLEERKRKFIIHLGQVKEDTGKMALADSNKDGTIDAIEWDAFCTKLEEEFLKEETARGEQVPDSDKLVVKRPQTNHSFIISTRSELELLKWFKFLSIGGILSGIAAIAFGVWRALSQGYSPKVIVGTVAGALLAGYLLAQFKHRGGIKQWV